MGHVEKVDRTLPPNQMIFHVRRDAELRRRWREDFDATGPPTSSATQRVAWPRSPEGHANGTTRFTWIFAAGVLLSGCASTPFTPRTVNCGRLTPVPNPSGRIELPTLGVSIVPPQANRWCMSPMAADVFSFGTHPLMGKYLEAAPTAAEAAHTLGILVMSAPPPKDAKLDTPEELLAVAQHMLGGSGRFRTVESRVVQDASLGADCITFDAILEERDNPRAPGLVLQVISRQNHLCRHPYARSPTLVLWGASERYVQGTVSPPSLVDALKAEWEPSVRSVQFLHPR